MINTDHFINETIIHRVVELDMGNPIIALPQGVIFTGEIAYSGQGNVYLSCLYRKDAPVRNFRFLVIYDGEDFLLPYNFTLVGSKIYPEPGVGGGARSISVYVEKEL
jgi:hypothetical protein